MKKLISLLAILASAPAFAGNATWTNPTQTACTQSVKKSCANGATLTDITSVTPSVISSTIAQGATSFSFPSPTDGAVHTYSLVYNGFDASGNVTTSTPATTTAQAAFVLAPPTGFTVTIQ